MKKSTKIKLALLPSMLLIPAIVGVTLTSCQVIIIGSEENKPEPEKPNPPTPSTPTFNEDQKVKPIESNQNNPYQFIIKGNNLNNVETSKLKIVYNKKDIGYKILNKTQTSLIVEIQKETFAENNQYILDCLYDSNLVAKLSLNIPKNPEPPIEPSPEEKYQIKFKDQDTFSFGDPTIMTYNIESTWLKNRIILNKNQIFEIPSTISANFDWNTNLKVGTFYGNADLGEINLDLTLNNAGDQENTITKNIKIEGFKSVNTSIKTEVQRINGINDLSLIRHSLTQDELDFVDKDSVLYYLNHEFKNPAFNYVAVNFNKNETNKTITFNIDVTSTDEENSFLPAVQTKQFTLSYELDKSSIEYSVQIKLENQNQSSNYAEWIPIIAELNTKSTFFYFEWEVIGVDGELENQIPLYTNKNLLTTYAPGQYTINVKVKTKNNVVIAQNSLTLNLTNEYYSVEFIYPENPIVIKGKDSLNENINTKLPSYYETKQEELKQLIQKNKELIFQRVGIYDDITTIENENMNSKFIDNLKINKIQSDDKLGKLTINLTLNNATSDNQSITAEIYVFGFNKTWSDDELITNALNQIQLTPNKKIDHMTAQEGVEQVHTLFDIDEIKAAQNGIKTSISAKLNPNNEGGIIIELTGMLLTDSTKEKAVQKEQNGFMVIKNLGALDRIQNTILKTPQNAYSYKDAETIRQINTNYLDTGDWFSKANRFGWDQYEKEIVYQSRFALYQSFHDNFTEINYYSLPDKNNIHVVAEGVVKNDFNGQYIVQTTQEMWPQNINLKTGDILRVEYIVPRTNEKSFYPTTVTTSFSFSPNSMDLNQNPGWWKVFGMQLPGYRLNIQTVNNQGNVLKNWWNYSNNKMRSFVFSIGGSQGRKQS